MPRPYYGADVWHLLRDGRSLRTRLVRLVARQGEGYPVRWSATNHTGATVVVEVAGGDTLTPAQAAEIQSGKVRPCPNARKGDGCSVCGARWICLESWRPKADPDN
jgi:hypothetical protein